MKVDKVTIRSTDLQVHPVGLGTNAVGGQRLYPHIKDDDGRELLHAALNNGADFWDTAYIYGPKRSEEIIGEVLKETNKRHSVVLATKAAHQQLDDKIGMNNSPAFLKKAVDEALTRLKTDYIDLFYIHFPDEDTPKYEAVGALKELKDQGKIRAIGVSNFSREQLEEANKDGYVNVYQGEYNLLEREAEKEIFPYALNNNISFVPFFPLASGLLAGKYDEHTTFHEGDLRTKQAKFQGDAFKENLKKVDKLKHIAEGKNIEVAHLVLAWYLQNDVIDAIIPGAKRGKQVIDNLTAGKIVLDKKEIRQIDLIFK